MTRKPVIRDLLQQMPLERLAPETRRKLEAVTAAAGDDEVRAALRLAAGELLREGELVRVAIEGGGNLRGPLFLLRGTNELLDLGCLAPVRTKVPEQRTAAPPVKTPPVPAASEDSIASVLGAMEQAQDLAVGDPTADEPTIVVERILGLLTQYVPDVTLVAQLNGDAQAPAEARHLVSPPQTSSMPFWLRHRRAGQSLWIPDAHELPERLQLRLDIRPGNDPVTAVVPLWSPVTDTEEVGLLYVSARDKRASEELLKLAHRLADFVSRRWRCQRDVNRRVLTDSLTGIHNRAFFDSQFPLELERARRGNFPLTLVIGDLDRFKSINDTHGHQCGDLVLREVARQLQVILRRIDYVCRIGGEEFAFILPYTSTEESREVLARVVGRPFSVSLPPELGVGVLGVTMSYGAVTFPDAGASAGELHRKADSMLYQAKELGRNRCCLWFPDGRHQQLLPSPPLADEA